MANPPMTDNDIAAIVSAAVLGERERCAKIAEQTVERYNPDVSAIDVRMSFSTVPKWQDGKVIAAAIRNKD